MDVTNPYMIELYKVHKLIDQIQIDKARFKHFYAEGDELIEVRENLNNRVTTIRELLLEQPENNNLNFELEFCLSEIERIDEELEQFQSKYESKEAKIDMYQKLIEYDIRELLSYIDLLERLNVDKKLVDAIKTSVDSIEDDIAMLNSIKK